MSVLDTQPMQPVNSVVIPVFDLGPSSDNSLLFGIGTSIEDYKRIGLIHVCLCIDNASKSSKLYIKHMLGSCVEFSFSHV